MTDNRPERLTPLESQIMDCVWDLGEATSRQVMERLEATRPLAYTTVQTVMNTLEKKGMLTREKIGLVNFYRPTRSRESIARDEMDSLIARVFGGSIPAVANSLLSSGTLDRDEIEAIKKLLDRKERELEGTER